MHFVKQMSKQMPEQFFKDTILPTFDCAPVTHGGGYVMDDVTMYDSETFEPRYDAENRTVEMIKKNVEIVETIKTAIEQTELHGENYISRDKNSVTAVIRDFKAINKFWIKTPTFNFDSHTTKDWYMVVKQKLFQSKVRKTKVRLVYSKNTTWSNSNDGVRIAFPNNKDIPLIKTVEDVSNMFIGEIDIIHVSKLTVRHKPLSAYSDEDLLAEVSRRSKERLDGYIPKKRKTPRLIVNNVIELPVIKPIVVDEDRINRILEVA